MRGTYTGAGTTTQAKWTDEGGITLKKVLKAMEEVRGSSTIRVRRHIRPSYLQMYPIPNEPVVKKDPYLADPFTFYLIAGFGVICGQCIYATVKKMKVVWDDAVEGAGEIT